MPTHAPRLRIFRDARTAREVQAGKHDGWKDASSGFDPNALNDNSQRRFFMLYWAAIFFLIALLAAFFGFGGIATSAVGVAKILFVVFLVLAVVSLVFGRRIPTS